MFTGFDKHGEPGFDTPESAMEYASTRAAMNGDEPPEFFVQRVWAPLWFAHLVQYTRLDWLAYRAVKS